MLNYRTWAALKREFIDRVFSKGFILMTILLPLFMLGLMGLQTFLILFDTEDKSTLHLIAESPEILAHFEAAFDTTDYVRSGEYNFVYASMDSAAFDQYYTRHKEQLLENDIAGMLFVPARALQQKTVSFYSINPNNNTIMLRTSTVINRVLIERYYADKNISMADLAYARQSVDFNKFRVTEDDEAQAEGFGNLILSIVFTMLLYTSLIMIGQSMLRSVVEEKTNRIVEVLLSSLNSQELMVGKIVGTGCSGLLQMAIWMIPIFILSLNVVFMIPEEFMIEIKPGHLFYFLLNYLIGLLTFLGLFAAVGSIFDNEQDAQSGLFPVIILILIPFYVALTLFKNPASIIAQVTSLLPFFAIIVMPARMALMDIPLWEFAVSLIVNLVTMIVIFKVASKIYRVGILMTGKKPLWRDVVKWLKYKH